MNLLIIVIALALIFDLINGFHDAANSIATVVSTKVLTPYQAVVWAAFFNFIAYLVFGLHVANTIGKGIVHPDAITLPVVLSGLCSAIIWNLITWWYGIPSSSSHTLIGGFVGAAITHAGFQVAYYAEVFRIVAFIFLAPVIGMIISIIVSLIILLVFRGFTHRKADSIFRRLQLVSSALYSIGHGANDAQKVMGIIFVSLVAANRANATDAIPFWIVISCQSAMAIGTLMGGWRIVKTMGTKITHLRPFEGFSAETGGAITLFTTGMLGIPVSTTHTITGAIIGAGVAKRISAVRWGVTRSIIVSWIITIPFTSLLAALIYYLTTLIL